MKRTLPFSFAALAISATAFAIALTSLGQESQEKSAEHPRNPTSATAPTTKPGPLAAPTFSPQITPAPAYGPAIPAPTGVPSPTLIPPAVYPDFPPPAGNRPRPAAPSLAEANAPILDSSNSLKVFNLRNADANDSVQQLRVLFGNDLKMVADTRTNTILASGPLPKLNELEAVLLKLEETKPWSATTKPQGDGKLATMQQASGALRSATVKPQAGQLTLEPVKSDVVHIATPPAVTTGTTSGRYTLDAVPADSPGGTFNAVGAPPGGSASSGSNKASGGSAIGPNTFQSASLPSAAELEDRVRNAVAMVRISRAQFEGLETQVEAAMKQVTELTKAKASKEQVDAAQSRLLELRSQHKVDMTKYQLAAEEQSHLEKLLAAAKQSEANSGATSAPNAFGAISPVSIPDLQKRLLAADADVKATRDKIDALAEALKEPLRKNMTATENEVAVKRKSEIADEYGKAMNHLNDAMGERNRLESLLVIAGRGGRAADFTSGGNDGLPDFVVRNVTTTLPNGTQTTRQEVVAAPKASEEELRQLIELAKLATQSSKAGKFDESAAILQKVTEALEQQRRAAEAQRGATEAQGRRIATGTKGGGTARAGVSDSVTRRDRAASTANRAEQLKQQLHATDAQIKIAKNLSDTVSKKIADMVKTSEEAKAEIVPDIQRAVGMLEHTANELRVQLDDFQNRKLELETELANLAEPWTNANAIVLDFAKNAGARDAADLEMLRDQIRNTAESYRVVVDEPVRTDEEKKVRDSKLAERRAELKEKLGALIKIESQSQIQELKRMRDRLDRLEKSIQEREKNRAPIIDRRVEELLNAKPKQTNDQVSAADDPFSQDETAKLRQKRDVADWKVPSTSFNDPTPKTERKQDVKDEKWNLEKATPKLDEGHGHKEADKKPASDSKGKPEPKVRSDG